MGLFYSAPEPTRGCCVPQQKVNLLYHVPGRFFHRPSTAFSHRDTVLSEVTALEMVEQVRGVSSGTFQRPLAQLAERRVVLRYKVLPDGATTSQISASRTVNNTVIIAVMF